MIMLAYDDASGEMMTNGIEDVAEADWEESVDDRAEDDEEETHFPPQRFGPDSAWNSPWAGLGLFGAASLVIAMLCGCKQSGTSFSDDRGWRPAPAPTDIRYADWSNGIG